MRSLSISLHSILRARKTLRIGQPRIPGAKAESYQWHAQTDARDGKQSASAAICNGDCLSLRRSNRIRENEREGVCVDVRGEGRVVRDHCKLSSELRGKSLSPDGAADGIAQRGSDVVASEVETSDDSDVLMSRGSLDGSLSWIREQTSSDTKQDFRSDDAGILVRAKASAILDEEAESHHEEHRSDNDERLEASDEEDDDPCDDTGDDGCEAVDSCDAGRR